MIEELNPYYYVYSENIKGYIRILTKDLFEQFDNGKFVVLTNETESVTVLPFDYQYELIDDDNYTWSLFKPDKKTVQTSFQIKLLSLINAEWYNALIDYWNSKQFLNTLLDVSKLRESGILKSDKSTQFDFLKNRIHLTNLSLMENHQVWDEMREKLYNVYNDVVEQRKQKPYNY